MKRGNSEKFTAPSMVVTRSDLRSKKKKKKKERKKKEKRKEKKYKSFFEIRKIVICCVGSFSSELSKEDDLVKSTSPCLKI